MPAALPLAACMPAPPKRPPSPPLLSLPAHLDDLQRSLHVPPSVQHVQQVLGHGAADEEGAVAERVWVRGGGEGKGGAGMTGVVGEYHRKEGVADCSRSVQQEQRAAHARTPPPPHLRARPVCPMHPPLPAASHAWTARPCTAPHVPAIARSVARAALALALAAPSPAMSSSRPRLLMSRGVGMLRISPLLPSPSSCSSRRITAVGRGGGGAARRGCQAAAHCDDGVRHGMGASARASLECAATPAPPTRVCKHAQARPRARDQQAAALGLGQQVRPPLLAPQLQPHRARRLPALHGHQAGAEGAPVLDQLRGGRGRGEREGREGGM